MNSYTFAEKFQSTMIAQILSLPPASKLPSRLRSKAAGFQVPSLPLLCICVCMYIYIYTHTCLCIIYTCAHEYIYIYIEREQACMLPSLLQSKAAGSQAPSKPLLCICVCIYIYIHVCIYTCAPIGASVVHMCM